MVVFKILTWVYGPHHSSCTVYITPSYMVVVAAYMDFFIIMKRARGEAKPAWNMPNSEILLSS